MVDDIDESLNETGTSHYMRARSYWQEVARIRKAHPNCVFVQEPADVETALHHYC